MDCLTFRKNINACISGKLSDEELNAFLRHLDECPKCREELEINYIVSEGVGILDEEQHDYNISRAYQNMVRDAKKHIRTVCRLRLLSYAADTLAFWGLLAVILIYIRMRFFPA